MTAKNVKNTSSQVYEEDGSCSGISTSAENIAEVEHECPICLQTAVHPVKLPCTHIFCYLCVKGIANRSKRCALCRTEIPPHYLHKPTLLEKEDSFNTTSFEDGFQWFYEGNRGWWQYDERTSQELEVKFKEECKTVEILIAGFLYIIDFENMIQYRRNDPSRRRRIKRDHGDIAKKGIAGLRIKAQTNASVHKERQPDGENSETDDAATVSNTAQSSNLSNLSRNNNTAVSNSSSSSHDARQDTVPESSNSSTANVEDNHTGSVDLLNSNGHRQPIQHQQQMQNLRNHDTLQYINNTTTTYQQQQQNTHYNPETLQFVDLDASSSRNSDGRTADTRTEAIGDEGSEDEDTLASAIHNISVHDESEVRGAQNSSNLYSAGNCHDV